MKMKNESRMSRMKSVGVLGNIRGLWPSIMSMDSDGGLIGGYCACPEVERLLDLQSKNGCLRGNNNSDFCIKYRENLITEYKRCIDKEDNKANRDACEVGIIGLNVNL